MSRVFIGLAILTLALTTTAAAEDLQPSHVTIKAPDGVALKATYYPAAKPGPALMLLHMCNSDRTAWSKFATAASSRGYHVLTLDFRGFGESGGDRFTAGQEQQQIINDKWPGDVDAALTYLVSQPGVDKARIGASGGSCGVNQATQLARRHPEVKTLVLLSGGVNREARDYLRQSAWLPVLASASLDDGNTVQDMRWILSWSRNPANKFIEYKKAGHGTEMFAVEKELEPQMLAWFDKHLKNAPATPDKSAAVAPPSDVERFWDLLAQPGGPAKARAMYEAEKAKGSKVMLFPEGEMNLFGYELIQQGRAKDAIVVFEMNVAQYPASANTYDSLSDAYLEDGNKAEALKYAEKTLKVLETDTSTPDAFKQLVRESAERKVKELKK
jgi:pimeloyl-ACP methyl ester carboxylesterase